ncbi:MAG: 7-cyano-7-deazaguanine synthase QueC [Candidatus Cloacimonadales bacterium]|jgi:7-cyano-7-deazaguanine synthase|nr:7-cyano-7-deazaguanine synthase QueC [Candidatus Cloacimonadota bacterium]MDD2649800.1 7-cyano-7-deazaguanine synthase QueC [Candidatus Cloacimonadota bacterium]MDX9977485.1 7-cyano-7-deazaguanine synthase QueC [Candidatus Cloacimonadales bacterium]
MKKAIILASGGMDSLVTTAIAKNENDDIYLLHTNYGQRTEDKELMAFRSICSHYSPKDILIVNIDYLAQIGGNSLTDKSIDVPKNKLGEEDVPNTYVPFRNGNLIAIATSWAEVIGAQSIYIGAVEVDGSGYPDCRKIFYDQLEKAINYGTKEDTKISIKTPLIHKNKSEIIKLGKTLNVPFELSWSCYNNNDIACGECDSCILRLRAFDEAGIIDPIKYIKKMRRLSND